MKGIVRKDLTQRHKDIEEEKKFTKYDFNSVYSVVIFSSVITSALMVLVSALALLLKANSRQGMSQSVINIDEIMPPAITIPIG